MRDYYPKTGEVAHERVLCAVSNGDWRAAPLAAAGGTGIQPDEWGTLGEIEYVITNKFDELQMWHL